MVSRPTEPLQIAISADFFAADFSLGRDWEVWLSLAFSAAAIRALSALLKYNVTVKAPAVVRPEGDLRIVEATATGQVQQILVAANDNVERGDPLVILDDAEVRSRQQQVQAELDQLQRQQQQIQQELVALDSQTQAETRGAEGAIAAAQAQLDLRQRSHREQTNHRCRRPARSQCCRTVCPRRTQPLPPASRHRSASRPPAQRERSGPRNCPRLD